jgi:toxin YoeB
MEIIFSSQALQDLQYWKKSGNKIVMEKITRLIEDIQNPSTMASANLKH